MSDAVDSDRTPVTAEDAAAVRRIVDAFGERRKGFFDRQQWSGAIIAILTVFATTAAQYCAQSTSRQRELTRAIENARRDAGDSAYFAVATLLRATDEWLRLAQGAYDTYAESQRRSIVDTTNAIERQWNLTEDLRDLALAFHYGGTPVASAWTTARMAADSMRDCAQRTTVLFQGAMAPRDACSGERTRARQGLERFKHRLVDAHRAAATGRGASADSAPD